MQYSHNTSKGSQIVGTIAEEATPLGILYTVNQIINQHKWKIIQLNLDLINEVKETTEVRNAAKAQQVTQYYNSRVKNKQFQMGDLVLRNTEANLLVLQQGKMNDRCCRKSRLWRLKNSKDRWPCFASYIECMPSKNILCMNDSSLFSRKIHYFQILFTLYITNNLI
ncbi:hypothetical protein ES332_A10G216000v1 [Gossypium tomentosum]|uniref:Uncharacterized protein n=1 Tax=Gossypium tomentosum TaxID=34277 RepID=A0A5D2NTE4_GOSTO|nr:hypothetical protein ES332_A10G216000v1 [Gossypium tomentosum]